MITAEINIAIDSLVPKDITHIGFVATTTTGEFLVTKPKRQPYGVSATFAKTRVLEGEPFSRALDRCIMESLGHQPVSLYPIPGPWVTPNSRSYFFGGLGELWQERPPAPPTNAVAEFCWCSEEEAALLFKSSKSASKKRDLAVLSAAAAQCFSPFRRILLMLRELHQMGFERLRAPAYDYPLAWRCPIVPAAWTLRNHGGKFADPTLHSQLTRWFGDRVHHHTYSSGDFQRPFSWAYIPFATPRELAERFIREQPQIAFCGWGPDPEYVRWFETVLEMTKPNGVITAFFEDKELPDALLTHWAPVDRVPQPPGGWAELEEFYHLVQGLNEHT